MTNFIFDTYAECVRFAQNNGVDIMIRDHGDTQYIVTILED